MRSGDKAANDKFLPAIHATLDPGAGAFSRFVEAVPALGDDAFEALLSNYGEHDAG